MKEYLPYFVSVITAAISAVVSIFVCKKQTKTEIEKIQEQTKATLEIERERLQHEKEKLELEHKLELEKLHAQYKEDLNNQLIHSAMQIPEIQAEIAHEVKQGIKKKQPQKRKR